MDEVAVLILCLYAAAASLLAVLLLTLVFRWRRFAFVDGQLQAAEAELDQTIKDNGGSEDMNGSHAAAAVATDYGAHMAPLLPAAFATVAGGAPEQRPASRWIDDVEAPAQFAFDKPPPPAADTSPQKLVRKKSAVHAAPTLPPKVQAQAEAEAAGDEVAFHHAMLADHAISNSNTFQNPLFGMEEEEALEDTRVAQTPPSNLPLGDRYPSSNVHRIKVEEVDWMLPDPNYYPPEYTAPSVLAQPAWADPPIEPGKAVLRFNAVDRSGAQPIDRTSFEGFYQIVNGMPRNPRGRTGLRGRGLLGRWGPNHAADPIVTRWAFTPEGDPVYLAGKRVLEFVTIRRADNGKMALPGGFIEPGEQVSLAVRREFGEEALATLELPEAERRRVEKALDKLFKEGQSVYRGYVEDDRNTDNAWIESDVLLYHDDQGDALGDFALRAGDDAKAVQWTMLRKGLVMHASHASWLAVVAEKLQCYWEGADDVAIHAVNISMSPNLVYSPNLPAEPGPLDHTKSVGQLSEVSAVPNSEPGTPVLGGARGSIKRAGPIHKEASTPADSASLAQKDEAEAEEGEEPGALPESAPKQHKGLARSLSVMQSKTYADTLMQFRKAVETIKARGIDDGLHVGTYPASYWDKVAAQPGGPEVIKIAFAQIKKNGRPLKEADAVNVEVTAINIVVRSLETNQVLLTAPVKEIYFSGVAPQNNKAFGLICNERKAGTMTCHMFLTTGPASFLEQGVNKAFEAATQLQVDPLAIRRRHMNTPEAVATGFDKVQLTRENLLVRLIIGQGQFGQVFLAEYTAPGKTAADMKEVAVKLMRADASHVDAEEFLAEAHTLMQFDHPRCIGLAGVCFEHLPWLIVLDFMQYKDLGIVLRQCAHNSLFLQSHEQIILMAQVADGLKYLAEKRYIHRDIAARNVLLHHNNEVKLGDFGLTRQLPPDQDYWRLEKTGRLPVKYMAIETLTSKRFSPASDVWAFGVFMWEVLSYGKNPWDTQGVPAKEVRSALLAGQRLIEPPYSAPDDLTPQEIQRQESVHRDLYQLAFTCWAKEKEERYTAAQLLERLTAKLEEENAFHGTKRPVRDVGLACFKALEAAKLRKSRRGQRGGSIIRPAFRRPSAGEGNKPNAISESVAEE